MQAVHGVCAGGGTIHDVLYTNGGHGNIVDCAENGVLPGGGGHARDHDTGRLAWEKALLDI